MKRVMVESLFFAALVLALTAGRVEAQRRQSGQAPPAPAPAPSVPPPLIMPGPSAQLPPGVPSAQFPGVPSPAPSPFDATSRTYSPRSGSRSHGTTPGYGLPFYVPSNPVEVAQPGAPARVVSAEPQRPLERASGRLFLEVEPGSAQVFVDGLSAGTVTDFRGTGVMLSVGSHRIELRAAGYDGATFDVNIVAGQPSRYRGDLPPARRPAVEPATPRAPEVFYVIPGCYAGNRPPRERALPRGCDIAHVRTKP